MLKKIKELFNVERDTVLFCVEDFKTTSGLFGLYVESNEEFDVIKCREEEGKIKVSKTGDSFSVVLPSVVSNFDVVEMFSLLSQMIDVSKEEIKIKFSKNGSLIFGSEKDFVFEGVFNILSCKDYFLKNCSNSEFTFFKSNDKKDVEMNRISTILVKENFDFSKKGDLFTIKHFNDDVCLRVNGLNDYTLMIPKRDFISFNELSFNIVEIQSIKKLLEEVSRDEVSTHIPKAEEDVLSTILKIALKRGRYASENKLFSDAVDFALLDENIFVEKKVSSLDKSELFKKLTNSSDEGKHKKFFEKIKRGKVETNIIAVGKGFYGRLVIDFSISRAAVRLVLSPSFEIENMSLI